jgi:hypothetical protein
MNEARRRFSVSTPDWGENHLTLDAIVAFADDELTAGAHARATAHLAVCPECSDEVVAQTQARAMLQSATAPSMPSSLLSSLRSIPQDADLPEPPAGLAMTSDGQLVSVLRPPAAARPPAARADVRLGQSRRLRFGAGVAVTGLALGALALAAPSASVDAVSSATGATQPGVAAVAGAVPAVFGVVRPAPAEPVAEPVSLFDGADPAVQSRLDVMAPVYFPTRH